MMNQKERFHKIRKLEKERQNNRKENKAIERENKNPLLKCHTYIRPDLSVFIQFRHH